MNLSHTLLIGAQLLMPVSEQVPTLNVVPSCRGAAGIALADSQSYDTCMKDENEAREELLKGWQAFSAPNRVNCTAEASSEGLASYVELLVCLQIAHGAAIEQATSLKGARKKK
jgi:hypothetical protein